MFYSIFFGFLALVISYKGSTFAVFKANKQDNKVRLISGGLRNENCKEDLEENWFGR